MGPKLIQLTDMLPLRVAPSRLCSIALFSVSVGVAGFVVPPLPAQTLKPYSVELPAHVQPLPAGSQQKGAQPAFRFRGIKGWAWSPQQYLEEIPIMAKYKMNFLMNCYSSLWELGDHGQWVADRPMNFWYKPLPESLRQGLEKVVQSCKRNGIEFCFSMNPNLKSDRTFDYNSKEDFEVLWKNYAWMQSLGVRWFNVSLDDISSRIDAQGQARLLNEMLRRLRAKDPQAQLVFCPTWYAGTGEREKETGTTLGHGDTPGHRYTRELAAALNPDIYLFWTGPEVRSFTITREDAEKYKALAKHRLFIWDNYPNNNQDPTMHLGPITGRSADLPQAVDGYIANAMGFENESNRIPMLTQADYLWNPNAYDPQRSEGQALAHLASSPAQRAALVGLVELYPGRFWDHVNPPAWNSLRERFKQRLSTHDPAGAALIIQSAEKTLQQLNTAFPKAYAPEKRLLQADINAMRAQCTGCALKP